MKNTFIRCFIKAEDIALLRKIGKRQAHNHLLKIRAELGKKPSQLVTIAECAGYFGIPYEAVEEAVLFNDLPDEEEED